MSRKYYSGVSLLALVAGLNIVGASAAQAQTTSTDGKKTDTTVSEVVVTSTRIQSIGFIAPTPTTVVGTAEIQHIAAVQVTDLLKELPSFSPPQVGVGSPGTAGEQNFNLRGLNNNQQNTRTLLLVQGQRYVPTDNLGHTDASVIPTSLVDHIDVVTGGASASWGSDAVAGVVNVVLKDHLDGLQGNFQYGESQLSDFRNSQASLAWGTSFDGGRGQIMVAAEGSGLWDIPDQSSRSWGSPQQQFVPATVNGVKYSNVLVSDVTDLKNTTGGVLIGTSTSLTTAPGANGLSASSPFYGLQIGAGGALLPFTYTTNTNVTSTTYGVGGSGGYTADEDALGSANNRANLFIRSTYDVSDKIKAEASFGFATSDVQTYGLPGTLPGGPSGATGFIIPQSNPYLQALTSVIPAGTGTTAAHATGLTLYQAMVQNGIQTINIGRINPDLGQLLTGIQTRVYNLSTALNGEFGDTGHWTAYLSEGYSEQHISLRDNIIEANLRAALDPELLNGQIVCNPAVVAQYGAAPGCVPINPFGGPNSISQAASQYVNGILTEHNVNNLISGGATLNISPFRDWAGPVDLATGVEARQMTLSSTTNSNGGTETFNFGGTITGPYENANPQSTPSVSETVEEWYIETGVPLLSDLPFAKSLDANLAYRFTNYAISGGVSSWKVGATYRPIDGLLFRVTDSQDIRAPNLNELYQGATSGPTSVSTTATSTTFTDPVLPGQSYFTQAVTAGNPHLVPEIAHTLTYGFTLSPSWVPGLSASVDVWRIEVDDEISSLGTTNIVNGCYGQGSFASIGAQPQYCALISRSGGPGTQITSIYNIYVNIAYQLTNGVDYEIDYRTRLDRFFANVPGAVSFRALATNLQQIKTQADPALPVVTSTAGTSGNPTFRFTMTSNYSNGPFSLSVVNRFVGSQVYTLNNAAVGGVIPYYDNLIKSVWYTDMQLSYDFSKNVKGKSLEAYFNVNNLFDKDPPIINGSSNTYYDVIGRAFVLGVRFKY